LCGLSHDEQNTLY